MLLAVSLVAGSYVKAEHIRAAKAFNKGQKEFEVHRFNDAVAAYTTAISLDGEYYLAYCWRAMAYHALKHDKLALQDINEALRLNRSWTLHFEFAETLSRACRNMKRQFAIIVVP